MAQGDGGQVEFLDELVESLRDLHNQIIEESGGVLGEHTSSLYAACARPFQTAFGEDLYPTEFEKMAAFFHAVIADHVFVDGNKRTATIGTLLMIGARGYLREESLTRLHVLLLGEVALATAAEGLSAQDVTYWLRRIFDPDILAAPAAEAEVSV